MAKRWIEKVFEVQSLRQNHLSEAYSRPACGCLSVYVCPKSGLSDEVMGLFFDQMRAVTARIPGSEFLIPCRDRDGHVGRAVTVYMKMHGGWGMAETGTRC